MYYASAAARDEKQTSGVPSFIEGAMERRAGILFPRLKSLPKMARRSMRRSARRSPRRSAAGKSRRSPRRSAAGKSRRSSARRSSRRGYRFTPGMSAVLKNAKAELLAAHAYVKNNIGPTGPHTAEDAEKVGKVLKKIKKAVDKIDMYEMA
jgi:hypothetical protein